MILLIGKEHCEEMTYTNSRSPKRSAVDESQAADIGALHITLSESQMATYESVTYALEHTSVIDASGNLGNALQQVAGVTGIAGEVSGAGGDKQFRIFADMKPGGIDAIGATPGFKADSNIKARLLFFNIQPYHKGFPDSYRQDRKSGVTGMEAGLQPSYSKDKLRADIDVDYRFLSHLGTANSDIRAKGNYQRFIDRWPGLRNWWDK